MSGRPGGRALALSFGLHLVAGMLFWLLPMGAPAPEPPRARVDIVFFEPEELEPPPPPPPVVRKPKPRPRPEPVELVEAPPESAPRRAVTTPFRAPAPPPRTKSPGFAVAEAAPAPKPKPAPVVVRAGFGLPQVTERPPLRATGRTVSRSLAFLPETESAEPAKREERAPVVDAGFAEPTVARPQVERTVETVAPAGFAAAEVVERTPRVRRQPEAEKDRGVEILFKPKPVYTARARELRIEGEVVLEVTFVGSGVVEVHRVVEGLGHGLDQAAVDAAEKIRFTPARKNGRQVDHTATLRVVFRLA